MDLPGEEEQKELIHAWLVEKGDGEAVIESFLPQILEIARTHTGKGVLFGDLVQEGNIGLLEAMAIYQGKDAEGFLAHAKSAVEDSILDAIAMQRGSDSVEKRWRSRQIVWMMLLLSYQKSLEENQRLKNWQNICP